MSKCCGMKVQDDSSRAEYIQIVVNGRKKLSGHYWSSVVSHQYWTEWFMYAALLNLILLMGIHKGGKMSDCVDLSIFAW